MGAAAGRRRARFVADARRRAFDARAGRRPELPGDADQFEPALHRGARVCTSDHGSDW